MNNASVLSQTADSQRLSRAVSVATMATTWLYRWTSLLLLTSFCSQTHGQGPLDGCDYTFVYQPPSVLGCDPHDMNIDGGEVALRLRCSVWGVRGDFTVQWYRQEEGGGGPSHQLKGVNSTSHSTTVHGALYIHRFLDLHVLREELPGMKNHRYWCAVQSSAGVLGRSSELLIRPKDAGGRGGPCSQLTQFTDDRKCADPAKPSTELLSAVPHAELRGRGRIVRSDDPVSFSPTPTPTPSPPSVQTALYVVIAIIVLFCVIIIVLAVVIVLLYRRKMGRARTKTADSNAYSGLPRQRTQSPAPSVDSKRSSRPPSQPPTRPSSRPPSIRSQHRREPITVPVPTILNDHLYSHLRDHEAPPPATTEYPTIEYSQLGPRDATPPPRPPKPPQLRASSQPPETVSSPKTTEPRPFSQIYSDDVIVAVPPVTSIYNTLDSGGSGDVESAPRDSRHYYHVLEGPAGDEGGGGAVRVKANGGPPREVSPSASMQKNLFDDPEYSPLRIVKGRVEAVEVVDPRYVGDYERSPNYEVPTVTIPANEIDPKYLGDYERDPTYIPKPPPRSLSDEEERPPKPPQRRQSLGAVDTVKYSGDYERDPTYVPPPLRRNSSKRKDKELVELKTERSRSKEEHVPVRRNSSRDKEVVRLKHERVGSGEAVDPKYLGDYERDPTYMERLQRRGSEKEVLTDYSYPQFGTDDLIPPHIPHEYKTLEAALRDPPQQYARLTSEPPETTIASITTTV